MTAEIAVMNRMGVALAADSAVTVGGPAGDKIWTSADKLFLLSEKNPVGVMLYGNAEFMGMPWETVIKTYRKEHGSVPRDTVTDHAENFLRFLADSTVMLPMARQDFHAVILATTWLLNVREQLQHALDREAELRNGLSENDVQSIVDGEIRDSALFLRSQPNIVGLGPNSRFELRNRIGEKIDEAIRELFGTLPMARSGRALLKSSVLVLLTKRYFGPMQAGLVFAGFGELEYLPAVYQVDIEIMVNNVPRVSEPKKNQVDDEATSMVLPFAQMEVVQTFMNGIDPHLFAHMQETSIGTVGQVFDAIIKVVKTANSGLGQQIESAREETLQKLGDVLSSSWRQQIEAHWGPVVDNIDFLPKDELAAMAEAFVNLTRFRRRVAFERETVGGPIDVAVITKGDGFVWVKRKHYFNPELNPRFFSRYRGG